METVDSLHEGQSVKVWLEECAPYPAIGEVVGFFKTNNLTHVLFGFSEDHDLGGEEMLVPPFLIEPRERNPWE